MNNDSSHIAFSQLITHLSIWDFMLGGYLSAYVMLYLYPFVQNKTGVNSFDRIFGVGYINNWDVTKLINNYYAFFILFILLCLGISLIVCYMRKKADPDRMEYFQFITVPLSVGWVSLFLYYIVNDNLKYYSSIMSFFILISILYFFIAAATKIYAAFDSIQIRNINLLFLILSFALAFIFKSMSLWKPFYLTAHIVFVIFLKLKRFKVDNKYNLSLLLTTISPIFLITSIYIEIIHILNQYSIFISKKATFYTIIIIIFMAVWGLVVNKKSISGKYNYFIIIAGLSSLAVNIPLISTKTADIFESANSSILVSDFLGFGKIPIIEHYGGHMLSEVIGGILYGILNQDKGGAIFSPYSVYIYPFICCLFFVLLTYIIDAEWALWIVLFLPVYSFSAYWGAGIITILSVFYIIKVQNFKSALLFWLLCILLLFYRLDLGVAFLGASSIVLIVYCIYMKNGKFFKYYIKGLLTCFIIGLFVYGIICIWKDINFFSRIKEFVAISSSNTNWAYAYIGDNNSFTFYWYYLILPLFCCFSLVYICVNKALQKRMSRQQFLILLILGLAYFFNFSRGCVRHSLAEGISAVFVFDIYAYVAIFITIFINKKAAFIWIFAAEIIILNGGINKSDQNFGKNMVTTAEDNITQRISDFESLNYQEKVTRILYSDELLSYTNSLKDVINSILDKDESWIDFANTSFLYSALDRESPVYIAQSPGHLSGEFSQELFISQINNHERYPIALLPGKDATGYQVAMDGILNNYRYYKVAEYLYQNYTPLCQVNDIAIWCLKEKKDNFLAKLQNRKEEIQLIDYGYDAENMYSLHMYYLSFLPYYWSRYDKMSYEIKGSLICRDTIENIWTLDQDIIKSGDTYLEFYVNNKTRNDQELFVNAGSYDGADFVTKYIYSFKAVPSSAGYLIRISSDYNWYTKEINAVQFILVDNTTIVDSKICQEKLNR